MKKVIAALILVAAATPAFASDGSEIANASQARAGYVAMDSMGSYAYAPRGNWHGAHDSFRQEQIQDNVTAR